MLNKQLGFSWIELMIVFIVIAGLAAIAIPMLYDLSNEAKQSSTQTIAANLSSLNTTNFVSRKKNPTKGIAVRDCTDLIHALKDPLPAAYTVTPAEVAEGQTVTCKLAGPASTTATFTATGIK